MRYGTKKCTHMFNLISFIIIIIIIIYYNY